MQVKNRRKLLLEDLKKHLPKASFDSFIDAERSRTLVLETSNKVYSVEHRVEISKGDSSRVITLINEFAVRYRDFADMDVIFIPTSYVDTGALQIKLGEFCNHTDYFLELSGLFSGRWDLYLVSDDLEYGLCVERTENKDFLVTWGFQKI